MRRIAICLLIALSFIWFGACQRCFAQQIIGRPLLPISGFSYPLNQVSGAWGAWSIARKLSSSYSGNAIKVQLANGTTQDIGFVSNITDTNTLLTFAGSGNAYIYMIYDQSGNVRDLTNTFAVATNNFLVVSNGVLVLDGGGKLCARSFFGQTNYAQANVNDTTASKTDFLVFKTYQAAIGLGRLLFTKGSLSGNLGVIDSVGQALFAQSSTLLLGPSYTTGTQYIAMLQVITGSNDTIQLNNGTATVGDAGDTTVGGKPCLGDFNRALGSGVYYSEWILYESALSAGNITLVQNNASSFYNLGF